jgi:hypothetical protein
VAVAPLDAEGVASHLGELFDPYGVCAPLGHVVWIEEVEEGRNRQGAWSND